MQLKTFIEQSRISDKLIRAVVQQIGGWQEFQERAQDISNSGADAGWRGFTYYSETNKFYRRNRKAIFELALDQADECWIDIFELIAGFNCLRMYAFNAWTLACAMLNNTGDYAETIQNALAWYALEEVARSYVDMLEQ